MSSDSSLLTGALDENDVVSSKHQPSEFKNPKKHPYELKWGNIIFFAYIHLAAPYGLWLMLTSAKLATSIFAFVLLEATLIGVGGGVHRLWSHNSYRAKWPLQLILCIFYTLSCQGPITRWAAQHRLHHKYTETDADPHNANRGFFFSHIGWVLCKRHPLVLEKQEQIDVSDLESNPIVKYQSKYYLILAPLLSFVVPTLIPFYLWNETLRNAYHISLLRCCLSFNITFLINSYAHLYGKRTYDKFIYPTENFFVTVLTSGEGSHNYHHAFPWDYRHNELGNYAFYWISLFIEFFARIGWAYDLRTASDAMIRKRVLRTGDGTHEIWGDKRCDNASTTHEN